MVYFLKTSVITENSVFRIIYRRAKCYCYFLVVISSVADKYRM